MDAITHTGPPADLAEHDHRSQARYHDLASRLDEMKEESEMSEKVTVENVLPGMLGMGGSGVASGAGAGLGAGVVGGLLGGLLFGRNGLNGVEGGGGVVTPMQLTSGLASVIDSNQNTTLLQSVGDVKAAVPLAEAQVQLAIAGSQAVITNGQAAINKGITDAIAASLASQNNINVNVLQQGSQTREAVASYGVANLTATKDAQFATVTAVQNSTKEILAALNEQNTANLQRQLTVAEQALLETRAESRARGTEVNVTQTVNQAQAQAQAQQQQQQQAIVLDRLCTHVLGLQTAVATNSNLIIGNTGATTTGAQTANPVNVRA